MTGRVPDSVVTDPDVTQPAYLSPMGVGPSFQHATRLSGDLPRNGSGCMPVGVRSKAHPEVFERSFDHFVSWSSNGGLLVS